MVRRWKGRVAPNPRDKRTTASSFTPALFSATPPNSPSAHPIHTPFIPANSRAIQPEEDPLDMRLPAHLEAKGREVAELGARVRELFAAAHYREALSVRIGSV